MPQTVVIKCNTVGALLDELAILARDSSMSAVMDATIDGPNGEVFSGFKIVTKILSDKSEVLDFELFED